MLNRKHHRAAAEAAKKGAAHHAYVMNSRSGAPAESKPVRWTAQIFVTVLFVVIIVTLIGMAMSRFSGSTSPPLNDPLTDERTRPANQAPGSSVPPVAPAPPSAIPEGNSNNTMQVPADSAM